MKNIIFNGINAGDYEAVFSFQSPFDKGREDNFEKFAMIKITQIGFKYTLRLD